MTRTYEEIVTSIRKHVMEQSHSQWKIGDDALEAAPMGTDHTKTGIGQVIEALAEDVGTIAPETLMKYRGVASQWPEARRRASDRAWSVHETLAHQPDRFDIIHEIRTRAEARKIVQTRNATRHKQATPDSMVVTDALIKARKNLVDARKRVLTAIDYAQKLDLRDHRMSDPLSEDLRELENAISGFKDVMDLDHALEEILRGDV